MVSVQRELFTGVTTWFQFVRRPVLGNGLGGSCVALGHVTTIGSRVRCGLPGRHHVYTGRKRSEGELG